MTEQPEPDTVDLPGDDLDDELDDHRLRSALEAVLLVVDTPVSTDELATAVDTDRVRVQGMLTRIAEELTAANSGFDLRFAGDGWRFYTRAEFAPYVERLLLDGARSKLTRAALETLAVIAYRQPVSRARVSAIRGVNVDGVIRTLVARGLISEVGTDPQTTATTYGTTELFLERLGLASLSELPDLAPLLPGVDVIDDLEEELSSDPRFAKLDAHRSDSTGNNSPATDADDTSGSVTDTDD
ncbi:SMC-Scp complex subunit ScpB [Gordonia sp. CPCC 205515]|uniref:SMC-Scp complex subunit ScpB n=1 Tax=Gordonia sp. CPCC 205515 TaxID=3140791 RepID=UPI003AF38BE3